MRTTTETVIYIGDDTKFRCQRGQTDSELHSFLVHDDSIRHTLDIRFSSTEDLIRFYSTLAAYLESINGSRERIEAGGSEMRAG